MKFLPFSTSMCVCACVTMRKGWHGSDVLLAPCIYRKLRTQNSSSFPSWWREGTYSPSFATKFLFWGCLWALLDVVLSFWVYMLGENMELVEGEFMFVCVCVFFSASCFQGSPDCVLLLVLACRSGERQRWKRERKRCLRSPHHVMLSVWLQVIYSPHGVYRLCAVTR